MTMQHFFGEDDYVVSKKVEVETALAGMDCDHPKMDECHKGCCLHGCEDGQCHQIEDQREGLGT